MGNTQIFRLLQLAACCAKKSMARARATAKKSQRSRFPPNAPTLAKNALSKPIAELALDLHSLVPIHYLLSTLVYFHLLRLDCSIAIAIIPLALSRSEAAHLTYLSEIEHKKLIVPTRLTDFPIPLPLKQKHFFTSY